MQARSRKRVLDRKENDAFSEAKNDRCLSLWLHAPPLAALL